MALQTLVQCGQPETINQNQVYTLPAGRVLAFVASTTATLVQSDTVGFSNSVPVTLTNSQAELAGGFLKCTSGTVTMFFKRFA